MKTCLIFFLLLGTCLGMSAKDRVIINPSFELSATGITHISKVELRDSETRLHIRTTFIPRWWVKFSRQTFIKSSGSGDKLFIKAIVGGELDKEMYMGASGDSSFVLVFPGLQKDINKIDLGEDAEMLIFGISLDKKQKKVEGKKQVPAKVQEWIDTEVAKSKVKTLVDYKSPQFFSRDTARLIGYIKGYDPRLNFYTGIIYASNKIAWEDTPVIVRIHDDGRFEADIPLVNPEYTWVRFKSSRIRFYIEPGQTLSMVLNWDEFLIADRFRNTLHDFKDVQFAGPAAQVNMELKSAVMKPMDHALFQKQVRTLTPDQFKAQQMSSWRASKDDIEEQFKAHSFSPHTQQILRNEVAMENASAMFDFIMNRDLEARRDTANSILMINADSSYYSFLQDLDLNDPGLLLSSSFPTFINRLEFSTPINRIKFNGKEPSRKFLNEYLFSDLGLKPTQEDRAYVNLLQDISRVLNSGISEAQRDQVIKDFNLATEAFLNRYKAYLPAYERDHPEPKVLPLAERELQTWRRIDSAFSTYYGLKPNLIYEVVKVRALKFMFQELMKKDEALPFLASYERGLTTPFLASEARRMFDKSYPLTPVAAYDLPTGKASEIFRKIIEPHKGKMLFVDFWGIYCGPCIAAIERNRPLRQKYKGGGELEFLFITSEEESPKDRYDEFVKKQELENTYKLSADDYRYLRQLFKFNGIPRYVVVNKDGQIMNDDFQMHNFESDLQKLLATK